VDDRTAVGAEVGDSVGRSVGLTVGFAVEAPPGPLCGTSVHERLNMGGTTRLQYDGPLMDHIKAHT
jgi:hypothetical protein